MLLKLAFIAMLGFLLLAAQGPAPKPAPTPTPTTVRYTDIRKSAGITFLQDSTQTEEKYYLETMGTGVAWIDYDQDGLIDLFFVQSAATDIYKPPHPLRCALYHNNGDGTFTDVTEKAGVGGEEHYGQGVAVGDFEMTAILMFMSPATAQRFSITTTATALSPTSRRRLESPTRADGRPAQAGSTTT